MTDKAYTGRESPKEEELEFDQMLKDPKNASKILAAAKQLWKEHRITEEDCKGVVADNNWKLGTLGLQQLCLGANAEAKEYPAYSRTSEEAIQVAYNHLRDDSNYYNERMPRKFYSRYSKIEGIGGERKD